LDGKILAFEGFSEETLYRFVFKMYFERFAWTEMVIESFWI